MPENADALREVQRSTTTPIAVGERLKNRLEAREYIEKQAMRIIQPDVVRCGGITEFRKIVYMAETQFMTFAPHNPNSPVCTAAHLHLAASSASFVILEEGMQQPDAYKAIFPKWEGALNYWPVPEDPGLGIKITDEFVRDHSIPIDKAERTT
jgi:galactonate dehydratase